MTRALTWALSASLAAACAGQDPKVEYAASVDVDKPSVVALGPDVEVVVGANEPVFRTNKAFWLYRGDRWYRSNDLRGSWVRIATPPPAIAAIVEPGRFANYDRDSRAVYRADLTTPGMQAPAQPQAPYPPPPKQDVPIDPMEPTDRVPDPTMPSQPDPMLQR